MSSHLSAPPSAAFWLNELRLAQFGDALALLDEPEALRSIVRTEYAGPLPLRALDELLAHDGSAEAHAVLVAWFLRLKKSAAVTDVAEAVLPPETLAPWRSPSGRLNRLAAALALYRRDAMHLLDVEVCHRWHSRRRCALELEGPRRALPDAGAGLDWHGFAAVAMAYLDEAMPKLRGSLQLRRVTFRRGGHDVLLAWSAPAGRDTVRHPAGHVVAGRQDDWTLLRVHRDGNRVDVTSSNLPAARMLADGLAFALWGRGQYRLARNPLTSDSLNELLRRMRAPDDDVFRLLEIAAEVPGLPDRPLIVVNNAGHTRIETAVEELRRHMMYAERWNTVHRVKLAFGDAWRIEVHFPAPDEDMVLTYSDLDRDKEVAAAFEEQLRVELGVEVHPRAARGRRRDRKVAPEPQQPGRSTWLRLLGPVLDEPAAWERRLLDDLVERGVVALTEHAAFRCGDGPALPGSRDTLDCAGEIEMPHGEVDGNDPFRQEDDGEHVCGLCGTTWHPGRFRLPVFRRLRVHVLPAGAWRSTGERLAEVGAFADDAPGVAVGVVRGQRAVAVFLPLSDPDPWHRPDLAAMFPTVWVSLPNDPRLADFGHRGVDLVDVIVEGRVALGRAIELGRVSSLAPGAVLLAATPAPSPYAVSPPGTAPPAVTPLPTKRFISRDRKGVWLDGRPVTAAKAGGTCLLISLLDHVGRRDDVDGSARRFRTAEQLVRSVSNAPFNYSDVQQWVSRTRRALREKFPGEPGLDVRVVEGGEGQGYRLGAGFHCHGFDLTAEVTKRQGSRRSPM